MICAQTQIIVTLLVLVIIFIGGLLSPMSDFDSVLLPFAITFIV